jgi:Transglutaminase-like superfamily
LCGIGVFFSWHQDEVVLRRQAEAITKNLSTDSERVRAINDWVYHNKSFVKNNRYFIVAALGPTPIQVMQQGGECEDKSRLVAAMLDTLGIDAGLVMIAPCQHCGFIHTVVEAQYEAGRMVVDPTWDVDYPTGDGRFLAVRDLAGTNRGRERVAELRHQRLATEKIVNMPEEDAIFDYAVAMNWDRNAVTRGIAAILRLGGYSPKTFFRPRLLEDPKLLLMYFLIGMAAACVVGGFLLDLGLRSVTTRFSQPAASNADRLEVTDA